MKFLLLLAMLFSCSPKNEEQDIKNVLQTDFDKTKLDSFTKVAFLIVDGVYNSELMAPYDIFHHTIFHTENAMKVFTVAPEKKVIRSFEGIHLIPDFDFNDSPDIDILVVPSAEHSMDTDLENAKLIQFVKERGEKAKYVLSLCDGAFVLAKAGLLDDINSTTFPSDIDAFRKMFPQLKVHENISFVSDGKYITSSGGALSYDPSFYLIHKMYGDKVAKGVADGMALNWDEYKQSYKHLIF